jgi:hypothetical protein
MTRRLIWLVLILVIINAGVHLFLSPKGVAASGLVGSITPTSICVSNPPPPHSATDCFLIDHDTDVKNDPHRGEIVTVFHIKGRATAVEGDPSPPP